MSNSDMQIQASRTSGSGAGGFVWDMTYDANRNGDISSVPTEEDLKAFYDYINGKSFKNRNVENGVAGLELYTWSFDTSKDSTLKKQVYPANTESTPVTISSGKLVATSKTSGTFLTEDNKRYNFSYDNESNTLFVEAGSDSLSYSLNYDDKGPGFINRVKGATYEGSGYTYKFSADGKTLTCISGTYENDTYSYVQQDANDRAVYYRNNRPWLQSGLPCWGLRLGENDKTLYWSPSSWAGASTTPTKDVSSNPMTRK